MEPSASLSLLGMGPEIEQHTKPFLRWAGSKRQLVPELARYWSPSYERYVEPFAGSACLFFHIAPKVALLADINRDLITTYRQVRAAPEKVVAALSGLRKSRAEYLRLRSSDISSLTAPARAARFIYLNRYCFNGLYRTNLQGRFNVPYGGNRTGRRPSLGQLQQCAQLLDRAALRAEDYQITLTRVREGDFVYLDPPFSVRSHRVFREYDASAFGLDQVRRLRRWLCELNRRGATFLVSYAASDEARFLAKGFHTKVVVVRRCISGFARARSREAELLISNQPLGA